MLRRTIGIAAIIVVFVAAVLWHFERPGGKAPAAAQGSPPGIPVTAGSVKLGDVPVYLHGIGTVQAYNTVAVKSRVDGQIVKIDFKEGQEVKAGDPLFQIDPRPYQTALEQVQAQQQKDQAQLGGAEADLARYGKLVGRGFQTRQSYEDQQALVGQLRATIKADQAAIDTAKLNLSYADIRAPIDGRLGARLVDKGNLVRASDNTTLVNITELKPIFVSFTLPQQDLDAVRQQQAKKPRIVYALAGDNKTQLAAGKLTLIDNMVDPATGTIHLKARFDNQDERLWPGEFVNVQVVLSVRRNVPTVPAQTVQEGPNGHYVYVIKPDETVERRAVEVAAVEGGKAVIAKGLSPGERVVVNGQYRLINGARIRVLKPSASS